ncbi:signal peptidase I [Clostridium hominis]|nr:signal peptidase I [Clostridium hominis]
MGLNMDEFNNNDVYIHEEDNSSNVDNNVENSKLEKRSDRNAKKKEKTGFFYDWVVPILIAVVLAVLINKFIVFKVKIPSESMVPTLNVGDRLFVTRVYNPENLERGDVVVFHSDEKNEDMIKRLIGKPGDTIVINDGIVTVNGETLYENYIGTPDKFNGTYEVPEGQYFFLGDNRFFSSDSRYWDTPYIDGSDIMGKAQLKVYPFDDFGMIK